MSRPHCSNCGRTGHNYRRCPEAKQEGQDCGSRCRTCGSLYHRTKDCGSHARLVIPAMRRCPGCWVMVFAGEAHTCGPRRRMPVETATARVGVLA